MGHQNFQQQNESTFLRNIKRSFYLCCTFLKELIINDHDVLLETENV